jgi:hypothetical protein
MNYRYDLVKIILCNPPHYNLKYLTQIYEKYKKDSKIKKIKNLNDHSNTHKNDTNNRKIKIIENNDDKDNEFNNITGKTPADSVGYLMNRGHIDNIQQPENTENQRNPLILNTTIHKNTNTDDGYKHFHSLTRPEAIALLTGHPKVSLGYSVISVAFLLFVWQFFFIYALLAVVYVSHVEDRFF